MVIDATEIQDMDSGEHYIFPLAAFQLRKDSVHY